MLFVLKDGRVLMPLKRKIRVLVLGGTGMLGSAVLIRLSKESKLEVFATARNTSAKKYFSPDLAKRLILGIDVENDESLEAVFRSNKPDVVINCIGIVKQLADSHDALKSISINSLLPQRLSLLCHSNGARLILMSTDCVFSGNKGNYKEADFPDCNDLYGRSKLLGEIADSNHVLTIRTSIIGHELNSRNGLLEWLLSQEGEVHGFKNAIFSGLPTNELANVICQIILKNKKLSGLFHVASKAINKYNLLKLIAQAYGKNIHIKPRLRPQINRSLNGAAFSKKTGYKSKSWPTLIAQMHTDQFNTASRK